MPDEQQRENQELENRLANAENLVNAIRNLEIDAIIGEHHVAYVQLKEVADTIKVSRELYRHIVRDAPIGIAEVDFDSGLFITANTVLVDYTGYTRDELSHITIEHLFAPESLQLYHRQTEDIQKKKQIPSQTQYKFRRKDSSEFWANVSTKIIYDEHAQPKAALIVINDITKEKTLEKEEARLTGELLHEKELLNTIMENTYAHLAYLNPDLIFIRVNSAFARDFGGGTQTDFEGKHYNDVFPDHEGQTIINKVIETRQPVFLKGKTVTIPNSPNKIYWNWAISPVIDMNNIVKGVVLSLMDITDLKQSEQDVKELNWKLLRRTYDLQNLNKELESFSYSISHDLRAPLRRISGFSSALLEDYKNVLDDPGKDYLSRIINTSKLMDDLVDALLKLSRLTRAPMTMQTVDLTGLSKDIIRDYKRLDPLRKVDVTIEEGLTAEGDQNLLRTLLDNIIGNAWKFTSKCPTTSITIAKDKETKNDITFCIKDNGIGFDMAYANKLFIPFQRLHPEGEYPGTGIGLGIANRIVNRHNGKIWAKSAKGQGATFYITLPKLHSE